MAGLKKYFIVAGIFAGALISAWYVYRLHLQRVTPGMAIKVDPIWTQFVNVMLIFFAAIFQFSLLHKGFVLIVRIFRGKGKG